MEDLALDKSTREWWKLTDPMQQPLDSRKENEWWAVVERWFRIEFPSHGSVQFTRKAYVLNVPAYFPAEVPVDHFAEAAEWGRIYKLKSFEIFKGYDNIYIYLETNQPSELSSLLKKISSELKTDSLPEPMTEVFHTENKNSLIGKQAKKVFVTGCFDMLHSGHIAFLQEAATFGDLYVSIGTDENVYQLKGRFPVNTQDERKYMIDALACVKKCIVNSGRGYIDFENELRDVLPDIFVVNRRWSHTCQAGTLRRNGDRIPCSETDTACRFTCKINLYPANRVYYSLPHRPGRRMARSAFRFEIPSRGCTDHQY